MREFLASEVKGIEGIGAVGAVFEQILLGLCEFFTAFVLAKAVATPRNSGGLYCENEVVVVLTVKERNELLLAGEGLVDEKVFLVLTYGVAEVNTFDLSAVPFKLVDYPKTKILLVDCIV